MRALVIAAAALLAGCAVPPYKIAASPGSVVLSYWSGNEQAAMDEAQRHCAQHQRVAVLRSDDGGAARRAVYECR